MCLLYIQNTIDNMYTFFDIQNVNENIVSNNYFECYNQNSLFSNRITNYNRLWSQSLAKTKFNMISVYVMFCFL